MNDTNPELGKQFIAAIKEQMKKKDPPETKETYNRLLAEGYPEEEVLKMLASVLCTEIFDMTKEERVFNRDLYVKRLHDLPNLPWDE